MPKGTEGCALKQGYIHVRASSNALGWLKIALISSPLKAIRLIYDVMSVPLPPPSSLSPVIDLSSLDPEDLLESGQLDEIPQCSFLDKPPSKKKAPSSASSKKKHKKQPIQAR